MVEVEKARQVLEAERKEVLDGLRRLAREEQKERLRRAEATRRLAERSWELLLRGKAVGVAVTEMAEAWETTRQRAHSEIRSAETNVKHLAQEARGESKRGRGKQTKGGK